MKRIFLLLITALLAFKGYTQTDLFTNLSQFGIGSSQADASQEVSYDSESNIIVFGSYSEEMDFDPTDEATQMNPLGTPDLFLAKYDQDGSLHWLVSLGRLSLNNGMDASGLSIGSNDDVLISGSFSSTINFNPLGDPVVKTSSGGKDAFLAKYNASGELLWVNTYGSLFFEFGSKITIDSEGNLFYGIRYNGNVDVDPGEGEVILDPQAGATDAAVVKYDTDGNYIWHFEISTENSDNITALATSNNGQLAIGATINGTVSGVPSSDMKIFILENDGSLSFENNFNNFDVSNAISSLVFSEEDNSLYVSGRIQGDTDFDPSETEELVIEPLFADAFFAKYNLQDFSLIWAKHIQGTGIEDFATGTIISGGALMAVGSFESTVSFVPGDFGTQMTSAGSVDIYMAAYDKITGEFIDAQIFGGAGRELATAAFFNPSGNVVVTGDFTNSLALSPFVNPISANGMTDVFFGEFSFQTNVSDGINSNFSKSDVLIYPVPAGEQLSLELVGAESGNLEIRIFSIVGSCVGQYNFTNFSGIKKIDIGDLNRGVYILDLNLNGERVAKRFVKN